MACSLTCSVMVAADARAKSKRTDVDLLQQPVDETLKEVVLSLQASAVTTVTPEKYAKAGLDALAGFDRCLQRKVAPPQVSLSCGDRSLLAPWPPTSGQAVATLLSAAVRLVDAQQQVRPERVRVVARALAIAVGDPFTAYLSPEIVAQASGAKSAFVGATPGIELWPRDPNRVREVRPGSDAAKQGLKPGDRILTLDGLTTSGVTLPEMLARMQGANETQVKLTLQDGRAVAVSRSVLPDTEVSSKRLDDGTLYVHVPSFRSGCAELVKRIVLDARPAAVILDLRHNGGGLVPEGIALADLFLRDGAIAGVRSGPGRPSEEYPARKESSDITAPLAVLVDGASASASELVSMVLKDRGRAIVLGAQTSGKGSVQRQIHLPDGGVLKVTAGYYVGPTGNRLDDGGVRPNRFLAPPSGRTVLEGGDPARDSWVLSALDALHGERAPQHEATYTGAGPRP